MTIPLEFTCLDAQAASYDNVLTLTADHVICGVNANPAAVWFKVTSVTGAAAGGPAGGNSVYDPQFHDILYQWDFGDPNNATPTTSLNMPDAWKDLNKGYGREVFHVYNDGGTHSVTVYAYEPATRRFGSLTFDVTIGDANVVFAASNTIIFNPGGIADTSAFIGALVITTTWADAKAARSARASSNCRILLAPGVTITDEHLHDNEPSRWVNIRIGAMDPAQAKPQVIVDTMTRSLVRDFLFNNRELLLYGLDIQGAWDSTTEQGRITNPIECRKSEGYVGSFLHLMHQCRFSGFGALIPCTVTASEQNTYNLYSDTEITNWKGYGIFLSAAGGRARLGVKGCSIHQHEDALSGGPKVNMRNDHGPIRDSGSLYFYMEACDFFSRNGWSQGGVDAQGISVPGDQPAVRVNTSRVPDCFSYMSRCALEGWLSHQVIGFAEFQGINGNHVIDKMLQVAGSRTNIDQMARMEHGGTTMRNVLAVKLNLPHASNLVLDRYIFAYSNDLVASENDDPFNIHNVTFLDLRNDTNASNRDVTIYFSEGFRVFSQLTLENNILVQPNRTGVNRDDEPLDLTTPIPGFTPRHKGPRFNFSYYETTLSADVSGAGGTLDIPYSAITEGRANTGNPTTQAYWQAIEATDTRHRIQINNTGGRIYHADLLEIAVTFGSTNITITNNSGTDWLSGQLVRLDLDRSSLLEPFDPQFNSQTQIVPLAKPLTGSQAIGTGNAGLRAYDDLLLEARPNTDGDRGAIQCP